MTRRHHVPCPNWCHPNACTEDDTDVFHRARIDRFKADGDDVVVDVVLTQMDEVSPWIPEPAIGDPRVVLKLGHLFCGDGETGLTGADCRRLAHVLLSGAVVLDRISAGELVTVEGRGLTDADVARLDANADESLEKLGSFVAGQLDVRVARDDRVAVCIDCDQEFDLDSSPHLDRCWVHAEEFDLAVAAR